MSDRPGTKADLLRENAELRSRLEESEETLHAIRAGEVDALVVSDRVYTLEGAETPYHHLVEAMSEGAATLTGDGTVLYCNASFGALLGRPIETIVGGELRGFVETDDLLLFDAALRQGRQGQGRCEVRFRRDHGAAVPVHISCSGVDLAGERCVCLIATDLSEQKRNEAILESDRLTRSILDRAADAIVVCDADGTITRASREAFRLAGHNCLFRPFAEVFPLEITGVGGVETLLARVLGGETLRALEARLSRREPAGALWLLVGAAPLRSAKSPGCVVSMVNTTEGKLIQRELRASEERYRVLVDLAPDAIILHRGGRIVYANSAGLHLFGAASPAEVIGTPILDRVHPDDRPLASAQLGKPEEGPATALRALRMLRVDGTPVDVETTSTTIELEREPAVQVIIRDVSERKRIEEALRDSRDKYQALIETTNDFVWELDAHGRYTYCGPQMEALWGIKPEEMLGRTPFDVIPEAEREAARREFLSLAESPRAFAGLESSAQVAGGRPIQIETSGVPFFGDHGELLGFRGVSRDITQARRAQEERERALAEARERAAALEGILAAQSDGVLTYDTERTVTGANPSFVATYGFDPVGLHVTEIMQRVSCRNFDGSPIVLDEQPTPRALRGVSTSGVLYRVRRGDGTEAVVETSSGPTRVGDRITGAVTVWHDSTARLRAEEALRRHEARLRRFYESGLLGVIYWNADGTLTDANDAFLAMVGHTRDDLRAGLIDWVRMTPPEYAALDERSLAELRATGINARPFEKEYIRKDGSRVPILIAGAMLDEARTEGVAFVLDITERKFAENALRELNVTLETRVEERTAALERASAYNRSLIEASVDPLVTISPEGRITDVNAATERATGRTREELLGTDFSDYFTEPERARAGYQQVFREGSVQDYPLEIRHRDGRLTPVLYNASVYRDEQGNVAGVFAAARDVTERKAAEEAVHRAAVYNRSLLETSLDPLVTISPDGKVTDVNAATERVTGRSRQELLGTDFSDYFTEPERARAGYRQVFREGSVQDYPLEVRHRDGRLTPVLYNAAVYRDERGEVVGVFAAARDVSERRRAESEVRAYQQHLEELVEHRTAELRRSNENLEQFAYVASHDLQEPLRMMASYSQLLERRYRGNLDSDASEFIGYIVDGAQRMQGLINDLLAYSRVGRTDTAVDSVDCNAVLEKVKGALAATVEQSGAVITSDPLPVVAGSESQFAQLLQNLVGNAIKFHGSQKPRVHVGAAERDAEWVFSVKDNGIGIEPQYAERIFQVFQRLHARGEYPGTGIGLAICKKIVETRGGRIWVESEPGRGSTFYFTLPRKGEAADA